MNRKKLILKVIVCSLFLVGIFLRVWKISEVPVALFGDEIDVGLQAKSILQTGSDYLGTQWPVIFHSFSEYRLPMQIYEAVPFIAVWGTNEIGVRSASIIMGFLSIIGCYFLSKELFDKRVATVSSLLMLFSPWHFNFSRQANDAGFLLPLILGGTYFFIRSFKNKNFLLISAILFGLCVYAYAIAAVFVPLLICVFFILWFKDIKRLDWKIITLAGILGLIVVIPYGLGIRKGTATQRISAINVINPLELEKLVSEDRQWDMSFWGRIFYNKYTVIGGDLFEQYTESLSPTFLFASGDPSPRHSISGYGEMYHFDFILVLLGLGVCIYKMRNSSNARNYILLISWILIAPIPSMLTQGGGNHAARLIVLLIPLIIISALGLTFLMSLRRTLVIYVLLIVLLLFAIFDVSRFMHRYFIVWPNESWRLWQYGFKETISIVKQIDGSYERIYFNNTYEPILPRFLFWYDYDMKQFRKEFTGDESKPNIIPGLDGFKLGDRYYFGDLKKPIENLVSADTLIVASGEKDITNPGIFDNPRLKLIDVVVSPNKYNLFYIFSGK